jgi:hypothetical protein
VSDRPREYRTRWLFQAAYLIAAGAPYPTIEGERPRTTVIFADPEGEWRAVAQEYEFGDEESCCVPAKRLFESYKLLQDEIHATSRN